MDMERMRSRALCAVLALAIFALAFCALAQDAVQPGEAALPGAAEIDLAAAPEAMPSGVKREGETVTITSGGSYRLHGALEGQLVVDADGKSRVTLALDGVDISNPSGSAICVENAGIVTLLLPEGSVNRVTSGSPAALDGSAVDADAEGGAIHAKDDLTIEGAGALFVGGYINNGIHCSDDLTISGGKLEIEAVRNGVKGKDSATISGGELKITCGGDGVVSDETEGEGNGAVSVSGGKLEIVSAGDGVQAEALLNISGGELKIQSGGGSANAPAHEEEFGGRGFGGRFKGFGGGRKRDRGDLPGEPSEAPTPPSDNSGEAPGGFGENPDSLPPSGGAPGEIPDAPGEANAASAAEEAEPDGAKGLKSGGILRVSGGSIAVDASDNALHADGDVEITGGSLTLSSGDDGVHADDSLRIGAGAIAIETSYEGIEANQIAITGGNISVTATDDGLNANGGAQTFRGRGPFQDAQPEEEGETPVLRITGGEIRVNAEGDGLDSNSDIRIEGGLTIVDGPSHSGNGALDSGSESGGSCQISSGTVLAIGAAGMAESFDAGSEQASLQVNFEEFVPAGSALSVTKADGKELISHSAAKDFSSVVFSCPEIKIGDAVTVSAGEQTRTVTVTEVSARNSGRWGR